MVSSCIFSGVVERLAVESGSPSNCGVSYILAYDFRAIFKLNQNIGC